MHYIRLFSPPKVNKVSQRHQVQLTFAVTTDLGDAFLCPAAPVRILLHAVVSPPSGHGTSSAVQVASVQWTSGMRIAKPIATLPQQAVEAARKGDEVSIRIAAAPGLSADGVASIFAASCAVSATADDKGLIMPVSVSLGPDLKGTDFSFRSISLNQDSESLNAIQIEEDIGDSIARHLWDAGVIAACSITNGSLDTTNDQTQPACLSAVRSLITHPGKLNILELGCGVGVLGLGVTAACQSLRGPDADSCTVVMTDLDEAQERAASNMARFHKRYRANDERKDNVSLLYENLDWEEARHGRFGPLVGSRCWDLIILSDCIYNSDMLPLLVGTLSAIHQHNNESRSGTTGSGPVTNVFLVTKPRHHSEKILFDLMDKEGWAMSQRHQEPLPSIGRELGFVEFYLFKKT